jgi:hypothetical protein
MSRSLKTLLLFDPEIRHYRQSVYSYFQKELKTHGYDLKVVYDKKRNNLEGGFLSASIIPARILTGL